MFSQPPQPLYRRRAALTAGRGSTGTRRAGVTRRARRARRRRTGPRAAPRPATPARGPPRCSPLSASRSGTPVGTSDCLIKSSDVHWDYLELANGVNTLDESFY